VFDVLFVLAALGTVYFGSNKPDAISFYFNLLFQSHWFNVFELFRGNTVSVSVPICAISAGQPPPVLGGLVYSVHRIHFHQTLIWRLSYQSDFAEVYRSVCSAAK
jgi:hypothetical protein